MLKNLLTHAGILEKDIQCANLPNGSLESPRIQFRTEIGCMSYRFKAPPGLQASLALIQEIHTRLGTFVNQNWNVAFCDRLLPTSSNMVFQTAEWCSEASPLYLCVQKFGDIASISLSPEMVTELKWLSSCGWT
jgi:hypothetical protein